MFGVVETVEHTGVAVRLCVVVPEYRYRGACKPAGRNSKNRVLGAYRLTSWHGGAFPGFWEPLPDLRATVEVFPGSRNVVD